MAVRLRLAALGHTMERGKVVEWYVPEGGEVVEGAPLFAVETDKAVVDVEAPAGGVLLRIDAPVNREYPGGGDARVDWRRRRSPAGPDGRDDCGPGGGVRQAAGHPGRAATGGASRGGRGSAGRDRPPAAGSPRRTSSARSTRAPRRRWRRQEGVRESEPGNRALESKASGEPPHDVIPLKGIRRVTAERLSAHWTGAPQVTEGVDIDMTEVRAFRTATSRRMALQVRQSCPRSTTSS